MNDHAVGDTSSNHASYTFASAGVLRAFAVDGQLGVHNRMVARGVWSKPTGRRKRCPTCNKYFKRLHRHRCPTVVVEFERRRFYDMFDAGDGIYLLCSAVPH